MSIENINKNQICDDQLDKVSGGDSGDVYKEIADNMQDVKPLYKVGDRVEVYNTGFHVSTKAGVIQSVTIRKTRGGSGYIPYYTVYIYEDNETKEVISDDIER